MERPAALNVADNLAHPLSAGFRLTITGVYPGSKYEDTCISELSPLFIRETEIER